MAGLGPFPVLVIPERAACFASLKEDNPPHGKSNMKKDSPKHGGKREGSGRKATGKDPMRGLRMSDDLVGRVGRWAKKQPDVPKFATAARRLIEYALENWRVR